ncbi:MAG: hypothetical protein ABR552_02850 [Actinomycetota bacterium]
MRTRLIAIAIALCSIFAFAPARALPAPDVRTTPCDATDTALCLLPFPNDTFTVADPSTATGRRVAFLPEEMPRSVAGKPIDPTEWNRNDGFSPGSMLLTFVARLDLHKTWGTDGNSTGGPNDPADHLARIDRYEAADAPIVIIDAQSGQRWPFWSELDMNAQTKPDERLLIIRPARNFLEGHRYVVGLRSMLDANGGTIPAGAVFAAYRDHTLPADVLRQAHYDEKIFPVLDAAGVSRASLFLAWDFSIASGDNLAGRVLHMRDTALASLGGSSPSFAITGVTPQAGQGARLRRIDGTVTVPNFLDGPPGQLVVQDVPIPVDNPVNDTLPNQALLGRRLLYGPDGLPMVNPAFPTVDVPFVCTVPAAATPSSPAHPMIYGHGLLGSRYESTGGSTDRDRERNFMPCAVNWMGFAEYDIANAVATLADPSNMPTMADRSLQGFVNAIFLERALRASDGLVTNAAFQDDAGHPLFNNGELYYDGNSQGGIMGGALCALSVDLTRCVLGVPGMNYSTLLNRSSDWEGPLFDPSHPDVPSYSSFLYTMFPNKMEQQLVMAIIQMLWDRAEGDGYALRMTTSPYPNTPAHQVLMHAAFGDFQVTNFAAEVEGRTIGARILAASVPARTWSLDPTFGFTPLATDANGKVVPYNGSAFVYWDAGNLTPPNANVPPDEAGGDPHEFPRRDTNAADQKVRFWLQGLITDASADNYQTCFGTSGVPKVHPQPGLTQYCGNQY